MRMEHVEHAPCWVCVCSMECVWSTICHRNAITASLLWMTFAQCFIWSKNFQWSYPCTVVLFKKAQELWRQNSCRSKVTTKQYFQLAVELPTSKEIMEPCLSYIITNYIIQAMAAPNHFSSSALFPDRPLMMVRVSFCEICSFSFPAFLCWLRIASFLHFLCFFLSSSLV